MMNNSVKELFGYTEKQLVEHAHEWHYMSFSTDQLIEQSLALAYKISGASPHYQARDSYLFDHTCIMYVLLRRHG